MTDLIVMKVDRARVLLAAARDAGDCKRVADVARAAEVYAKRQKLSEEVIQCATAVKVDAMTLMGEFLKAGPKKKRPAGPGRGHKGEKVSSNAVQTFEPPSQEELLGKGGRKVAAEAQALARLKEETPELHEAVRNGEMTVARARRRAEGRRRREDLEGPAAPPAGASSWEVRVGDCVGLLGAVPAGTVRLAFADPPYNIGIDYGRGMKADQLPDAEYLAWCREWMALCAGRLTPDGSLWVLIGDEYADHFGVLLKDVGLHRRQWLVWYESFGVNHARGFNRCSRHLFWMVKDPRRFVFNPAAVTRPSDRQAKYGDSRADPAGKLWDSVWGVNPPIPRLVGTAGERIDGFPTQLPLTLLRPVVGCASDRGDLVLDPFCGSATTGVVAVDSGRRFVGIEANPDYARLARARLGRASGG
jgi:site-specific DNA-methyltransferase (adenine-specific)